MVQFITIDGLVNYSDMIKLMEERVNDVINGLAPEVVYLVEHKDVYTAGSSYEQTDLLNIGEIPVIYTGRGGKFTFHGPGQRVIYPILNLNLPHRQKDLKLYVRLLERWMINSLLHFGVESYTIKDRVGIWVKTLSGDLAKLAAIGVKVRKWVAYHGIAINIFTDLSNFLSIVPCGLKDSLVTSLSQLGINISMAEFDKTLQKEFLGVFKSPK